MALQKYWVTFKIGWQDAFEYRTEFFISLGGWAVRLLIAIFIWIAVFNGKQQIGNYNFENLVIYFILTQIVTTLVFSRVGFQIGDDINTGDFSNYLIKPISYSLFQIISEFSRNLLRTIIGTTIFIIILALIYPDFFSQFQLIKIIPILISLFFAYLINALITTIIGFTGFWLNNSSRLMYVYFALITAISGITIPLDLFPAWTMKIFYMLPFSYIFYFPVKIIQNNFDLQFYFNILIGQLSFVLGLTLLMKTIYKIGLKKYEAVGR